MVTHSEEDKKEKNLTWSKLSVSVPYLAKVAQLLFQMNRKRKQCTSFLRRKRNWELLIHTLPNPPKVFYFLL